MTVASVVVAVAVAVAVLIVDSSRGSVAHGPAAAYGFVVIGVRGSLARTFLDQ